MRPRGGWTALAARDPEGPRIRVAALLLIGGRVVLVRHRRGGRTYHLLPGGGVEYGETLDGALVREALEETGLSVRAVKPLFISDTLAPGGGPHVVNITFLAEVAGGEITRSPRDARVEAVDLVDPDELAGVDLRPPMAGPIADAVRAGFPDGAVYLGVRWTDGD
jgi:8-oxo-dGTP diphosphatase